VAELPGVQVTAGVYNGRAMIEGERTFVNAASDLGALREIYGAIAAEGTLDTLRADQIAVESRAAAEHGLSLGDQVTVQLARGGPHTLTVSAIFPENELPGRYILPEQVTTDLEVPQPYLGLVQLSPGTPVTRVEPEVKALLVDSPEVSVVDRSGYVAQQTSQLDTVLIMIQVLLALAILIAVLGIVNTLALSVLERTRELGLLRAVGLGRAATMRMVTVESVVISVFGALLGVVVGSGMGAAVARALDEEGITRLAVPWSDLGVYLVLAGVVGVVAAVLPAVRAARTDVLGAIAYE
jgi:putative ABC transport system permease protein